MVVIGLTGGIGAGKSTFAACLAQSGAMIIDVDAIGREVIAPGGPCAAEVLARFGTLDRREIAAVVFADDAARHELESISWPVIERLIAHRLAEVASEHDLVVLDMAVLAQGLGRGLYGPVITIEAGEQVRLARLVDRGMSDLDAAARMRAQVPEAARIAIADFVVRNDTTRDELCNQARGALVALGIR